MFICRQIYPDGWYKDDLGMTKKMYSPQDIKKLSIKIYIYK